MARAIWKGSISFGLVNIPIELHTAVRDHRPRFRMLHAKDRSPVRFERVCIKDGHPVAWLEPTTEAPRAEVVDLMERLRRSMQASGTRQRSAGRERRSAAAEKRPAKSTRKAAARKRSRRAA